MAKTDLTAERLRDILNYNLDTGEFHYKLASKGRKAGTLAGSVRQDGRKFVTISGVAHYAHRLAWLHQTGEWPKGQIDHIDTNPANNAFCNLRDVTPSVNMQNRRIARIDNSSGFLGVTNFYGMWQASIRHLGKKVHLGTFSNPIDASNSYMQAKRLLHEGCTI